MLWTSVSRSESTGGRRRLAWVQGSGRRRPSMPLRGALAPARGQALSTARQRRSCAWAPARAHTSVHAQAHALAGARAPARACALVNVQAPTLVGARAREIRRGLVQPRGIKLGDNVRLPAHQCHGDGRWRSRGKGSRNRSGDRRDVFPQGQFKLVRKRLMFLRLWLGVFLMKLEH